MCKKINFLKGKREDLSVISKLIARWKVSGSFAECVCESVLFACECVCVCVCVCVKETCGEWRRGGVKDQGSVGSVQSRQLHFLSLLLRPVPCLFLPFFLLAYPCIWSVRESTLFCFLGSVRVSVCFCPSFAGSSSPWSVFGVCQFLSLSFVLFVVEEKRNF